MDKIKEVIIVEGRYDKNTVSQAVDAVVLETNGFGIFSDREKADFFRKMAEKCGVIVLTDGDGAGFLIRNHLKGILPEGTVKQAYIPDVIGKEKRKRAPSKEGKLGVEGMEKQVIIDALRRAGATFVGENAGIVEKEPVTKADFYELGLTGGENSAEKRRQTARRLGLPERITANALLDVVNAMYSKEEFLGVLNKNVE